MLGLYIAIRVPCTKLARATSAMGNLCVSIVCLFVSALCYTSLWLWPWAIVTPEVLDLFFIKVTHDSINAV